jgi:uncharacterized protein YcbX
MHIESLRVHPLTGGRGNDMNSSAITYGGLSLDRLHVAYDPETHKRISSKPGQAPKLHRIYANPMAGNLWLTREHGTPELVHATLNSPDTIETTVLEFEEETPCIDLGDSVSEQLSEFLGKSVRLALKTAEWRNGEGDTIPPEERKNAPLHILSTSTVVELVKKTGYDSDVIIARLRPNIVINNGRENPHEEQEWSGLSLAEGAEINIHRSTPRCPVPGQHELTGDADTSVDSITRTYKDMPRFEDTRLPAVGVYAYPVNIGSGVLTVGDKVGVDYV